MENVSGFRVQFWPRLALVLGSVFFPVFRGICGDGAPAVINDLSDLNGKRLGVLAGTMLDEAANEALDYTIITFYDTTEQEIEALMAGEIDAFIDDEPVARYLSHSDPRLRQLEENMQYDDYAFAVRKKDGDLRAAVSREIVRLKADGTIDDMIARWVEGSDADRVMPDLPRRSDGPVLRFGSSPVSAPFAYSGPGGGLVGFDIELLERVAYSLGFRLVIDEMDFSRLIPSLLSEESDIVGACMSVTGERKRIVDFTESYYRGGVAVLVRNHDVK